MLSRAAFSGTWVEESEIFVLVTLTKRTNAMMDRVQVEISRNDR